MGALVRVLAALIACTLSPSSFAAAEDESVRRLISLVEYIGGDYTEAVRDGKIVNPDEFKEMQNFVASAAIELGKIGPRLPADATADVKGNLSALKILIEQKGDDAAIKALTKAVKNRVIDSLQFNTSPSVAPVEATARADYDKLCASCHGATGKGDGAAGKGMEPPPRNFHDEGVMAVSSPFKFYNTLVLGVEGTAMVSYVKTLSDDQLWSLAFYAAGLRHAPVVAETPEARWQTLSEPMRKAIKDAGLSLALLARASDSELEAWLNDKAHVAPADTAKALKALRIAAPYLKDVPRTAAVAPSAEEPVATAASAVPPTHDETTKDLDLAFAKVAEAKAQFAAADFVGAESTLLDGYLQGYEGVEATVSLKDKAIVARVEQSFIAARQAARAGDQKTFSDEVSRLVTALDESRAAIAEKEPLSTSSEFLASLVIILREGFEAFLIVGALLTLLTKTGATQVKKWVHAGWLTAIVAGFASYYLFTLVFQLSGAGRETVEAVATAGAAVVLFYVSFWLLNQAERSRWERYIKESVKTAAGTSGKTMTLFFLSFIAVYREAAETVLFYQALTTSAASKGAVALGFVAGCALLLIICAAIMRFGIRLPLRRFFVVTSSVMIAISIVLAGKAVNELVEAGFVKPTMISPFPTIDALGIYPNWESLGVQLLAVGLAAFIAWYSTRSEGAKGH